MAARATTFVLLLATAHAFAPTTRCAVSGLASSASPLRLRPAVHERTAGVHLVSKTELRESRSNLVLLVIGFGLALQFEWRFFLGYVAGVLIDKGARSLEGVTFLPQRGEIDGVAEYDQVMIDDDVYTEINWLDEDDQLALADE